MNLIASAMILFSVLVPTKGWYTPTQPIEIRVQASESVQLILTTFSGKEMTPEGSNQVDGQQSVDVRKMFPQIAQPGTYVLFAVPVGKPLAEFVGTPIVIEGRQSPRPMGNVPLHVYKVSPLSYITMQTDKGTIKALMWYDVAPQTVSNFLDLTAGSFFDGQTFHRIVPGFVIQGGDPTGTGFGGPGYSVQAEFNDRTHDEGVLSMARSADPLEGRGIAPRPEYANSAGSQFFICLTREKCQALDRRYTAFGQVFDGLDTVKAIASVELADPAAGKPKLPQNINTVRIVPVTAHDNPYATLLKIDVLHAPVSTAPATTRSTTQPTTVRADPVQ